MNSAWFRPYHWVYRPVSWQGFAIVGLALLFCAQAIIAVDRHSHSASDTLFGIFPYVVPAFLLVNWLASKKSAS